MSDTDGRPRAEKSPRRAFTRRTKILTAVVLTLALAEGSALGIRYFLTDHRFVIADNAQVDGHEVEIHAPTDGRVVDWDIDVGSSVGANEVVGRVEILGNATKPRKPVRSPDSGTIAQNTVSVGMYVTTGSLLATAYDLTGVHVTARIREESIDAVHVDAHVDVFVDGLPDRPVPAVVVAVGTTSAGVNQLDASPGARRADGRLAVACGVAPIHHGPMTSPCAPSPRRRPSGAHWPDGMRQ